MPICQYQSPCFINDESGSLAGLAMTSVEVSHADETDADDLTWVKGKRGSEKRLGEKYC